MQVLETLELAAFSKRARQVRSENLQQVFIIFDSLYIHITVAV